MKSKKCFECSVQLRLESIPSGTSKSINGFIGFYIFFATGDCTLDFIIEKTTMLLGKQIKVRLDRNAYMVLYISLDKRPLSDRSHDIVYFKRTALCAPVLELNKEIYCSEIDISSHEVVLLKDLNLQRNFESLFNSSGLVKNNAKTVCLDTYFSVMSQKSGYKLPAQSVFSVIIPVIVLRFDLIFYDWYISI